MEAPSVLRYLFFKALLRSFQARGRDVHAASIAVIGEANGAKGICRLLAHPSGNGSLE